MAFLATSHRPPGLTSRVGGQTGPQKGQKCRQDTDRTATGTRERRTRNRRPAPRPAPSQPRTTGNPTPGQTAKRQATTPRAGSTPTTDPRPADQRRARGGTPTIINSFSCPCRPRAGNKTTGRGHYCPLLSGEDNRCQQRTGRCRLGIVPARRPRKIGKSEDLDDARFFVSWAAGAESGRAGQRSTIADPDLFPFSSVSVRGQGIRGRGDIIGIIGIGKDTRTRASVFPSR